MRWGCQRNNQRSPKTLLFVFRRFACRPAAFLSVWGGQPEREASLFNLKFLAARVRVYVRQLADGRVFAAVCGQPVFEVGVVGADEDGGVFLVKIDFGGLFLLGRSCSHRLKHSTLDSLEIILQCKVQNRTQMDFIAPQPLPCADMVGKLRYQK